MLLELSSQELYSQEEMYSIIDVKIKHSLYFLNFNKFLLYDIITGPMSSVSRH